MLDSKKLLDGLCAKVGQFKDEVPSAGTKFRLMGLVEDILEVTAMLLQEVLEVVRREAVLDADVDIDYAEMAGGSPYFVAISSRDRSPFLYYSTTFFLNSSVYLVLEAISFYSIKVCRSVNL